MAGRRVLLCQAEHPGYRITPFQSFNEYREVASGGRLYDFGLALRSPKREITPAHRPDFRFDPRPPHAKPGTIERAGERAYACHGPSRVRYGSNRLRPRLSPRGCSISHCPTLFYALSSGRHFGEYEPLHGMLVT